MTGEVKVFRNRGLYALNWVVAVGAILLFLASAMVGPGPDPHLGDYIAVGGICLAWALASFRATRMRLEMSDVGVTVYKFGTTKHVAWQNMRDVTVDYGGLHIAREDGPVVTAGSMGTSWFASRLELDNRAEAWAREISERADAERRRRD